MAERKVGRREAIGLAPCHRLVKDGAGGLRVSDKAGGLAKKAVKAYLKVTAEKIAARAADQKKKTVTLDMVVRAAVGCNGVTENAVRSGHQGSDKGLSLAGVVRYIKKHCDLNISAEAKSGLLAAGEAYLRALGQRAAMLVDASGEKSKTKSSKSGQMVKGSKRSTVLERDLRHAVTILSLQ